MSKSAFLFVPVLTISLAGGCGRSLRALPSENQISIDNHRGILEKRDGVAVYVRPDSVPWDDDGRLAAFSVEITNDRDTPLAVSHDLFALVGEDDNIRRAVNPSDLEGAFAKGVAGASDKAPLERRVGANVTVTTVRYRPYCRPRHRRHYYRGRYYRYPYYPYYGYGYWNYGWGPFPYRSYYYDNEYEQQLARERISQFLAELWRERELAPHEVMAGHVVFAYHPAKKETVTLRLDLDYAGDGAEEQPNTPPAAEPLRFEFQFVRKK